MGRIQGLTDTPQVLTQDELLKTGPGYLFSATIAWSGANVGDLIYFRDGLDGAAKILVAFAVPTANGTQQLKWSNGKAFTAGLFYDEGVPGNVLTECTFK